MEGGSSIALSGIVLEPLSGDNYLDWSTLVKNYLAGQGLWNKVIVDAPVANDSDWEVKNRRALHVIQLACGNRNLPYIRHCETATDAWNSLSSLFGKVVLSTYADIEVASQNVFHPLLYSVMNGWWHLAQQTFRKYPDLIFHSFGGDSILHLAVKAEQEEMVYNLVIEGKQPLLTMKDDRGYTALALAAELTDNRKIAEYMVGSEGGKELLSQSNSDGEIPVLLASAKSHREMTRYLFSHTPWSVLRVDASKLLSRCISAEIFDVAAELINYGDLQLDLSIPDESNRPPIYALACIPSAFSSGTQLSGIQLFFYNVLRIPTFEGMKDTNFTIKTRSREGSQEGTNTGSIKNHSSSQMRYFDQMFGQVQQFIQTSILLKFDGIRHIYEIKKKHYLVLGILNYFRERIDSSESDLPYWSVCDALFQAAKYGIIEFINSTKAAIKLDLLWATDKNKRGILAHAVVNRQEKVFNLIREDKGHKKMLASFEDVFGNNILHLAAEFNPFSTNGDKFNAILQILREIQWFKTVERIAPPNCKESKNKKGFTPRELFTISHRQAVKESQQWLKDISTISITIGTVIITLMFTAAITVPGGNDQSKGTPIFLGQGTFTFFAIADAISLIMSLLSVLTFMSILISSYSDEEIFFRRFPLKLLVGFLTLFASVSSMMCAFYAALVSLLKGYCILVTAAILLAIIPIWMLLPTLLPLFFQILKFATRFDFWLHHKEKNSW